MSTTLTLVNEASTHAAAVHAALPSDGLLGLLDDKNTTLLSLIKKVAVTIGIGFVVFVAIVSRGAMAKIIIAALSAAILIWVVQNVTDVRDLVGDEVKPAASHITPGQHLPPAEQVAATGPAWVAA